MKNERKRPIFLFLFLFINQKQISGLAFYLLFYFIFSRFSPFNY